MAYRNLFISNLDKKDVNHFTSDFGLFLRRKLNKLWHWICKISTNATIIKENPQYKDDEDYFNNLSSNHIPASSYPLSKKKNANNLIVERYPKLEKNEGYIFVSNHTCPEDIDAVLNIIDRNAYIIIGSVESLKYDSQMYAGWLNGMIVLDVLDQKQRSDLPAKMARVLKTQSILIYPEASHNFDFNRPVKPLYDGPINLALKTGKKIVPICLKRDNLNKTCFIDVGDPIDVRSLNLNIQDYYPDSQDNDKYRVKALTSYLRDKLATSAWHLMERHGEIIKRDEHTYLEREYIDFYLEDEFTKMKWTHDVFDQEYITKKTQEERDYEEVVTTLSNLRLSSKVLRETDIDFKEFVLKKKDLDRKNVILNFKKRLAERNKKD